MSTLNWIGASGSLSWATVGNWDTGVAPVTGDTVNINFGSADINSGLSQSGVTLAALNIGPGFSGTIGTTGSTGDFLAISATLWSVNSKSGRMKINFGSVQYTGTIIGTAPAIDTGMPALEILGTHASNKIYMSCPDANSTVGVATRFGGETSTISEFDIQGGTFTAGAGCTLTTGKMSGGSVVTINSALTTLTQSGRNCNLTTQGTGAITTATITGQAFLNNRASGDSIGTLNIGPNATADFSTNPAPLTITNAVQVSSGGTFQAFSPGQVQLTGPAAIQIKPQFCDVGDIKIKVGNPVTVTVA